LTDVAYPVRFSELLGQERARGVLRLAAAGGRLPHAFLFCGIEGSGRRTAARMLAAALGCAAPNAGEACGECRSCRKLARGTHPDFVLIEPAAEAARKAKKAKKSGKKGATSDAAAEAEADSAEDGEPSGRKGLKITIDQARELARRVCVPPAESKVRVSVLWPAGRMNDEPANALLKTLEEPPAGNVLILCCREPGEVLPTIASRCQAVSFAPLPEPILRGWLEARGAEGVAAARLAYLAGGSLSRAERLLDPELPARRQSLLSALAGLAGSGAAHIMDLSEGLAHDDHRDELLEALKGYFRDAVVLAATGEAGRAVNIDFLEPLRALAAAATPADLLAQVELVGRAQAAIEANCDPQLALEALFFELSVRAV